MNDQPRTDGTALAELAGRPGPTADPEAELWFGAHPAAPATVAGTGLDEIIAADPAAAERLGARRPVAAVMLDGLSDQRHIGAVMSNCQDLWIGCFRRPPFRHADRRLRSVVVG